jgi:hypothetical protein
MIFLNSVTYRPTSIAFSGGVGRVPCRSAPVYG